MRHVVDWLLSDADRSHIQRALADHGQPASAEVLAEISRAKNLLLTPESYERSAAHPAAPLIAAVWRESEAELRRSNAFEFDDLLAFAVRLLGEHPHRLRWLRQRWRWILVDEFQDTSHAQAALVDLLAGPDGNLCVVGDDDQLIHGWRHADPRHILGFAERHPGHATIVLGRNFRSRSEILEAAVSCVSHNERRTAKALIAMRGPGGEVRVAGWSTSTRRRTGSRARSPRRWPRGVPPGEILVLARTGYATEPLQRALAHAGIPHRVLGSLGLYERAEVRDALAYLTLVQNPRDVQAFARAIGSPRRGVGTVTVTRLVTWARERHGGDLITASAHAGALDHGATQAARTRLVRVRRRATTTCAQSSPPAGRSATWSSRRSRCRAASSATTSTCATTRRAASGARTPSGCSRTCGHCAAPRRRYEEQHEHATLTGFLEHAAGLHAQELGPGEDRRITVSTIHRAKGTEAQLVVLLALRGAAAALVALARPRPIPERLAEERRLFYVAATRAKDRLLITHAAERGGRPTGGPSRFLAEAGPDRRRRPARRLKRPTRATAAHGGQPLSTRAAGERADRQSQPQEIHHAQPTKGGPRAARPHPRGGRGPVPPAVRARRDRLPRDDEGRPTTTIRSAAPRSPPTSAPSPWCSGSTRSCPGAGARSSSCSRRPPARASAT